MIAYAFAAGVIVGILITIAVRRVLRRELDLYDRARGSTLDFTATSRERR